MYKTVPKASFRLFIYYALPISLLCFLGNQVIVRYGSNTAFIDFSFGPKTTILIGVALLSVLNHYCETRKWRALMGEECSQRLAWKATMAGLVAGFVTPNRIGDLAGKTLAAPENRRTASLVAAISGSFLQGCVTVFFGLIAFILYPISFEKEFIAYFPANWAVFVMSGLMALIAIVVWRKNISLRLEPIKLALSELTARAWIQAGLWAFIRYLIFSTQLYGALVVFGLDAHWVESFSAIALLYLFQSYFPFSSFGDIGVREFFAMILFSPFLEFSVLAAAATLLVWTVNVAIPVAFAATWWPRLIAIKSK